MSQQDGEAPRPDLVTGVTTLEKAAQGGHGLITSGFDLGVLTGRNNVDDEMRQQSESSSRDRSQHSSSGSQHSSSGSQHTSSSSSSNSNVQYSGGRTGSNSHMSYSNQDGQDLEYEDEDDYDGNDEEYDNHNTRHGQITHTYSKTSSSQANRDNPEFTHYRRTRDLTHQGGENSLCESAHCVNVRCVVGPLEKNAGALVALRMRLVAYTLQKVKENLNLN